MRMSGWFRVGIETNKGLIGARSDLAWACPLPTINTKAEMAVPVLMRGPLVFVLFLVLTLLSEQRPGRAGSCQSYEAAYNLEARLREGMSLKQAQESVVQDEYSDGSASCFSAIKHEINQMPYAFPLLHRALYKRTRR